MTKKAFNQNGKYVQELINIVEPDFVFGNRYDRKLHFITNGSKRLTINGNLVGINETSPGTYLHVKGTGEMLRLETTASGGGQCYIDFD